MLKFPLKYPQLRGFVFELCFHGCDLLTLCCLGSVSLSPWTPPGSTLPRSRAEWGSSASWQRPRIKSSRASGKSLRWFLAFQVMFPPVFPPVFSLTLLKSRWVLPSWRFLLSVTSDPCSCSRLQGLKFCQLHSRGLKYLPFFPDSQSAFYPVPDKIPPGYPPRHEGASCYPCVCPTRTIHRIPSAVWEVGSHFFRETSISQSIHCPCPCGFLKLVFGDLKAIGKW